MTTENESKRATEHHCQYCDYFTCDIVKWERHLQSITHENNVPTTQTGSIRAEKYQCQQCDYFTSRSGNWARHLQSIKHKDNASTTPDNAENPTYVCPTCNKSHKDRAGLWRHKKKCIPAPAPVHAQAPTPTTEPSINTTELVIALVQQNKELQDLLMEDRKMFMELYQKERANTITNTITCENTNNNNTNSNNTFNLNFFLNEKCKDAITLDEFVTNLPVTVEDLVHTSQVGYVNGITDIFMKGLKDMDVYTRPIHCTDIKRETVYVKEPDGWKKDVPEENTEEKPKLRLAVKRLARKNSLQLNNWIAENPECEDTNSQASEEFIKISDSLLGGVYDGEEVKFQNTIMRNVLKKVTIEETKVAVQR